MTGTRYSHLLTHLRKAALLPVVVGALAVFGLAGCETVLENGVQRQPPATRTAIDEEPRPLPAETETPENKSDATIVVSDPLEAFEHAGRGTVAPETPYQWSGVIFVADTEGRHFELKRGCDVWVLIPGSDDVAGHLESLIGKKVEVFGRVHTDPTIYMRPAISVGNVVGPDGPFLGLALPEYPCPGDPVPPKPAPYYTATLMNGEIAVRGNLIWHAGKPVLSTPSGELAITVPPDAPVAELQRDQAQSGPAAAPSTAAMDVAAIGKWGFT
ncbi:MAG: hypothetical protein HY682_08525, partial [Chloroflexi bacterium]|nr:hypothetical protein [Chloroflexota bacterium]